jgi:hypothetical protein
MSSLSAAESWCTANASCSGFTTRIAPDPTTGYKVYFKHDQSNLNTDANWTSYVKAADAPAGAGAQQVWAKPQPGGAVAVLLINGGGVNGTSEMQHSIKLADIGLKSGGAITVRDIWKKADAAPLAASVTAFEPATVAPRSSSFWLLTPKSAQA